VADWRVSRRADGTWAVEPTRGDAPALVAESVVDGLGRTWVQLAGEVVLVPSPDAPRRRHAAGAATLEAPMPAQVTAVRVAPGDAVEAGAVLVLLEAMKMELPLRAPSAGQVRAVHCAPGDRVAPGRALVDLVPAGDDR
jgi:biotin carboxyl carrier protein